MTPGALGLETNSLSVSHGSLISHLPSTREVSGCSWRWGKWRCRVTRTREPGSADGLTEQLARQGAMALSLRGGRLPTALLFTLPRTWRCSLDILVACLGTNNPGLRPQVCADGYRDSEEAITLGGLCRTETWPGAGLLRLLTASPHHVLCGQSSKCCRETWRSQVRDALSLLLARVRAAQTCLFTQKLFSQIFVKLEQL